MSEWQIWLGDPTGKRIATLDKTAGFYVTRTKNDRAPFSLIMPNTFDRSLFRLDGILNFQRKPERGSMRDFGTYFIRSLGVQDDASGQQVWVAGYDTNDLLRRRTVAANAESAQAKMTDQADDMMKAIVTDCLGGDAAAGRILTSYGLSVAADLSLGPSITKGFSRRNVLVLLQDIADNSVSEGTNLYFDLVPTFGSDDLLDLAFTTFTGQRGLDRTSDSSSAVFFGPDWGNLGSCYYEEDHSDEENYIYALGQGTEENRNVNEVSDSDRIGASIWNRCEGVAEASNQSEDDGVTAAGNERLHEKRPVIRFGGDVLDAGQYRYGVDYEWGDLVTARYAGKEFDCHLDVVSFRVDENGQETITARLEVVE